VETKKPSDQIIEASRHRGGEWGASSERRPSTMSGRLGPSRAARWAPASERREPERLERSESFSMHWQGNGATLRTSGPRVESSPSGREAGRLGAGGWARVAAVGWLLVLAELAGGLRGAHAFAGPTSMCQFHSAALDNVNVAARQDPAGLSTGPLQPDELLLQRQRQQLLMCPRESQYNNLPQFQHQSKFLNPNLERQQRSILKHLNASFQQHLQLNGANQPAADSTATSQPLAISDLIDDQLLNEIVSPFIVDEAYTRAKELIVKRRKLESELARQGEFGASFDPIDWNATQRLSSLVVPRCLQPFVHRRQCFKVDGAIFQAIFG